MADKKHEVEFFFQSEGKVGKSMTLRFSVMSLPSITSTLTTGDSGNMT